MVADRLQKYHLKIKLEKCKFAMHEIECLSHITSHGKIKPNPKKRTACQKNNIANKYYGDPFSHIRPTRPFQIFTSDVKGPLPSANGNKYICVITDHFSKYIELFAISSLSSETVAKIFSSKFVYTVCRNKF